MSLERIAQQIVELGLLSESSLREFLPKGENHLSVEDFLRELVKQKKITAFQAKQLANDRGAELWFGSYLLLDKLGTGGMGQVYKAEHRRMKRTVALKTVKTAKAGDRDHVARFEREVLAAAKLTHPNIVTAHDAGENNDKLFLVMEYIHGRNLSTIVKMEGPFSPEKTNDLILQVARGLEFAHQHGIVHRDIKPSNLLLDEQGVVKILDLGLARIEQSEQMTQMQEMTNPGTVMGTADYMAPEQWSDSHTADGRSDLYALGCTLFFLLAGRAPYADDDHPTPMRKMAGHLTEPIPDLRAVRSDTPERLSFIYQKLMAKQSSDRFQSATELIAVLTGTAKQQSEISLETTVFFKGPAETSEIKVGKPKTTDGQPRSLLNRLGAFYLTVLCTVLIACAFGSLKIYSYLGQSRQNADQKPLLSNNDGVGPDAAKPDVTSPAVPEQPAVAEKADTTKPVETAADSRPITHGTPEFAEWAAGVAKLEADEQVSAVKEKLKDLNPHFNGKVVSEIIFGVVVRLEFNTDHIRDISPVRSLPGLRRLTCTGNYPNKGILRDLSPLKDLKLTHLDCEHNPIADLSPVKGMPLKFLRINNTRIVDLEPIRGMKINDLGIWRTAISDISPLSGMPLIKLICSYSNVRDLTPIADAKLEHLELEWTDISDLTPLKKMPSLRFLKVYHTHVKPDEIDSLKEQMPNCKFITKAPPPPPAKK